MDDEEEDEQEQHGEVRWKRKLGKCHMNALDRIRWKKGLELVGRSFG